MNNSKRKNFKGGRGKYFMEGKHSKPIDSLYKVIKDPDNNKKIKKGDTVKKISKGALVESRGAFGYPRKYTMVVNMKNGSVDFVREDKLEFIKEPEKKNDCPPCADKELTKEGVSEYFKNASGKELFELLGEKPPPEIPEFIPEEHIIPEEKRPRQIPIL